MKVFSIISTVFTLFILISCNQTKQDSANKDQAPVSTETQEQNSTEISAPADTIEVEAEKQPSAKQSDAEVMLNPPHGEPNHRCDIPVGAPLNSSPQNEKNDAEVMLNPPHGEPNHRCDIPVGDPLNSSPANTSQQAMSAQQTSVPDLANNPTAPTVENAERLNSTRTRNATAPAPATGEKPKVNPPHGQPWHRCDIAVGSPLP